MSRLNWKAERRAIEEIDHRNLRAERREEAGRRAVGEQAAAHQRLQKLEADRESNPMDSLAGWLWIFWILVVLAAAQVVLDVPVQYALYSVAFPDLSWLLLLVFAIATAAGLSVVAEATALVLWFDVNRPRRTVRLCLLAAAFPGAVVAASLTVLLGARIVGGELAPFLAHAVPVSLWVLGEALPICGGFLAAAIWTVAYPKFRDRRMERLRERAGDLERFLDWLAQDARRVAASLAILVFVASVLPAASPTSGDMAPQAPVATYALPKTDRPAGPVLFPRVTCSILIDATDSVEPVYRRQATDHIIDSLHDLVGAFRCNSILAGNFADEGAFAPRIEVKLPAWQETPDCSRAEYKAQGLAQISQRVSGISTYYRQQAQAACREAADRHMSQYRQNLDAALSKVRAVLRAEAPSRGRCTAISDVLAHEVTRSRVVAVVTDGRESCESRPHAVSLPSGAHVAIVIVPSRGPIRETSREAVRTGEEWEHLVPGLRILLPSDINESLWHELASGGR